MAIQTARIQVNGTWHNLTYNSGTSKWEATINAPTTTSFNLVNGSYPLTAEATNTAGTKATVTTSDPTVGNSLKLVVKERVKPVITIVSPSNDAYLSNAQQPVVFNLCDEVGGSGIKISTLVLKIDGTAQANTFKNDVVTNGYNCTFTPQSALANGAHSVTIDVSDNDGNAAIQKSTSFTVDTIPPTLNITTPANNFITANSACTVQGFTNDVTSSPVTVKILLNEVDQGAITINADGSFSKNMTLKEGANTISVSATDLAGKTTNTIIGGTLDTSIPNISAVTIAPNPVDSGASVIISVVIS